MVTLRHLRLHCVNRFVTPVALALLRTGTWLLAWPCFWSLALATPAGVLPDAKLMGLFGIGALLLRGAGCTVNDLWDADLDRRVTRTASRPLASGALSTWQGLGAKVVTPSQLEHNDYRPLCWTCDLRRTKHP
jgi:hypothetical protein